MCAILPVTSVYEHINQLIQNYGVILHTYTSAVIVRPHRILRTGDLKTGDWKMRHQIAGVVNVGLENS